MSNINNTSNLLKAAANSLKHTNVFLMETQTYIAIHI